MSSVSIRPATLDDLEQILKIEREVHILPWTAEHFEEEFSKPQSQIWVLTDDETDAEVKGYIVFWLIDQHGHLLNVAVGLEYRGLGYGKLLVRKAADWCQRKEATVFGLEVRKGNTAAVQLYQKMHFTLQRISKRYYSNGDDALMMELKLDGSGPPNPNEF